MTIAEYRHAGGRILQPTPAARCDCADGASYCGPADGIAFYVTAIDGPRVAYVAGPYRDHAEAMEALPVARAEAERLDPRAVWYAFGTARGAAKLRTVLGRVYNGRT